MEPPCKKKTYETEQEAKSAYPNQEPYKCPTCGKFHNTSNGRHALNVARGTYTMAKEWIDRKTRYRDRRDWRHDKRDERDKRERED